MAATAAALAFLDGLRRGRMGVWLGVCSVLLVAACSSSTSDGASGSNAVVDAESPTDDVAAGAPHSGGSDLAGELATAAMCDLIEPIVDDVVAAADLDIPLADDSPYAVGASECHFQFSGDAATVEVTVARQPTIYGDDVAALAASFSETTRSDAPAPTLGDEALLLESSLSGEAYAVFPVDGHVWVATVRDEVAGATGQPGADVGATAVAVGAAVLDGLGVR